MFLLHTQRPRHERLIAMTSTFEGVTGDSVHLQEISCIIPFLSSSDALLAAVFFKHINTSWELIDDVLALFKNRSFCTQDVTFCMAEDIYDRVREYRRVAANARDSEYWKAQVTPVAQHTPLSCPIPPLVAELVAEQIYSENDPLFDADDEWGMLYSGRRYYHRPVSTVEKSLRSMSLVHRSWTGFAQRCLRRRICIWSQLELQNIFHSPRIGPWVRELSYRETNDDCVIRRQSIPRLLCGILQRCPNLKRLILEVEHLPVTTFSDHRFINQIGSLISLENLWLHQMPNRNRNAYMNFITLCSVLENMRSLKSLSLGSLDVLVPLNPPGCFSKFLEYCPELTIDSMSFVGNFTPDESTEYFTWLIKSRQKLLSTELEISFPLLMDILEKNPELSMANVIKLQIRLLQFPIDLIDDVTAALQRFSSVRSLILVVSDIGIPEGYPVIPETVTFLHVHIDLTLCLCNRLKPERAFVNPLLAASSKLQAVTISASLEGLRPQSPDADGTEDNDVADVEAIYPFDSTFEYCNEKGIKFQLIQARHPPTFDEHSTDSTQKIIIPYSSYEE